MYIAAVPVGGVPVASGYKYEDSAWYFFVYTSNSPLVEQHFDQMVQKAFQKKTYLTYPSILQFLLLFVVKVGLFVQALDLVLAVKAKEIK